MKLLLHNNNLKRHNRLCKIKNRRDINIISYGEVCDYRGQLKTRIVQFDRAIT